MLRCQRALTSGSRGTSMKRDKLIQEKTLVLQQLQHEGTGSNTREISEIQKEINALLKLEDLI